MKVFITGASGLVGSNCLKYFKQQGWSVVGTYYSYHANDTFYFDTLNPSNPENYDVYGFNPDVILHCGALTHVDLCEDEPEMSYQQTVVSTQNMLEIAKKCHSKFIFISTDYIYDGINGPYHEDAPINPLSIYGKHKLEGEKLVESSRLDFITIRINNVYGDEERGKNFVARIVFQILEGKELMLKLPSDQYSTPVNAWDIARCLYLLIQDKKQGFYHISSTDYMSRIQLSLTILKYFPKAKYTLIPITTAELNQKAARPLQGGLKNHKFMNEYPDFCFSTVDDYIKKFI
jgi:dTDP-4-dehydrorhamnose reductase